MWRGVGADDEGTRPRSMAAPRRVFPELITEDVELGEEQVYGAAAVRAGHPHDAGWSARMIARRLSRAHSRAGASVQAGIYGACIDNVTVRIVPFKAGRQRR